MIEVRRARAADAADLATCHATSWPRPWTHGAFATLLADPAQPVWCAAPASASSPGLAGFVTIQLAGPDADLTMVAVAPPHRRAGLGQALVATALHDLATTGVSTVFLEVAETNLPARALYARLGFEAAGHRRGYYPPTPDDPGHALVLRWQAQDGGAATA
jgi:[ribosomal protein S18]-alanine N-acetyltransferase